MKRYQRQIILPEISVEGQKTLMESKVLVVGAGGLGNPAIQYLVSMGIGLIGIVDGDNVAESNLHRQPLFSIGDIGKNKAEVLKEYYLKRNEDVKVESYPFFLNRENATELIRQYDIVVDGTDNFSSRFLLNDVCCTLRRPLVFGAISQFEGQVSVFWRGHGPCYRCLVPNYPKAKIQNCAEAGVVGPLPGIIGTMQAIEVMKVLLWSSQNNSRFKPLIGELAYFDFLFNRHQTRRLKPRTGCRCLAENYELDSYYEELNLCHRKADKLIDVRELSEWQEFHQQNIEHWPLSKIEAGEFPLHLKNQSVTFICLTGIRAQKAQMMLLEQGFKSVHYTKESIYGFKS